MKIGIFGGTFNPPHMGHLSSLQDVLKKAGLSKIHVVPAFQNPLKTPLEGPTAEQRLEMTKLAVESWNESFIVDDQEIKRGGKSYTIETVNSFRKTNKAEDLYLIVGMDKFHELEQWKDIDTILKEVNLIVTSRPGFDFPTDVDELPNAIQKIVAEFDFNFIELKTERNIQFVRLKDIEISGSELRKWLRIGKNVEKFIPLSVENYIKKNQLYRPIGEKIADFEKFTEFCAGILFEKKAIGVRGFDLREMSAITEFTLVASGTSTRHASALAENVIRAVKEEYRFFPQGVEGLDEGRWVVVDYGSLIVHVFYDFVRQEYNIEKIWREAKDLGLKDPQPEGQHSKTETSN